MSLQPIICRKCNTVLQEDNKFCPCCGSKITTNSKKSIIHKTDIPIHGKISKILAIIGITVVIAIVGVVFGIQEYRYQIAHKYLDDKNYNVAYSIFDDLKNYRDCEKMLETILNIKYQNLQQAMHSINGNNYKIIGEQIDEFPLDYHDIDTIKSEYNQIKKNIEVIKSTKAYYDYAEITERSSTALRNAYANLINFNNTNSNWDLNKYLETVHDEYCLNLVFGIEWRTSTGETFYWREGENSDSGWLNSTLPNNKESEKEYYFYTSSPDKFGYQNKNKNNDKFIAYRISEVIYLNGEWKVKIYCYSDSRTLTLYPA